jgi:hypothetical protein
MFRLMTETYRDLYGFVPLGYAEIAGRSATYMRIMTPEFFKILVDERGEVVAFIFGIRDITQGIRSTHGRLYPFGFLKILYGQKRAMDAWLELQAGGIEYADSHHEAESNTLVQAEMKRMGGFVYKRHRIYQKAL